MARVVMQAMLDEVEATVCKTVSAQSVEFTDKANDPVPLFLVLSAAITNKVASNRTHRQEPGMMKCLHGSTRKCSCASRIFSFSGHIAKLVFLAVTDLFFSVGKIHGDMGDDSQSELLVGEFRLVFYPPIQFTLGVETRNCSTSDNHDRAFLEMLHLVLHPWFILSRSEREMRNSVSEFQGTRDWRVGRREYFSAHAFIFPATCCMDEFLMTQLTACTLQQLMWLQIACPVQCPRRASHIISLPRLNICCR
ncbi:hypothetical protein H6P81_007987 [Aristolochia fimbriata]|uniref:Uncharacterized protein n=1 Tax=Aristolochia fimbriata TaxID=158543 RepID=A0AAV7F235_ARIFI|nr:hypothetical protein H6P81_007987 [Aristolochia fimbriata]